MEASLVFRRDREASIGLMCFAVVLLVFFTVAGFADHGTCCGVWIVVGVALADPVRNVFGGAVVTAWLAARGESGLGAALHV